MSEKVSLRGMGAEEPLWRGCAAADRCAAYDIEDPLPLEASLKTSSLSVGLGSGPTWYDGTYSTAGTLDSESLMGSQASRRLWRGPRLHYGT